MMKLIFSVAFICTCLLNLTTNVVAAGDFRYTIDHYYDHGITESPKQLQFSENNNRIFFTARKISNTAVQFLITQNSSQNILYSTVIKSGIHYGRVYQIYNDQSGRYFYLVSLAKYMDGGVDFNKVMGFDSSGKSWKTYLDTNDYYRPKGYDESWIYLDRTGDLCLSFSDGSAGPQVPTQLYVLHWNYNNQKFDYVDKGFGVHKK